MNKKMLALILTLFLTTTVATAQMSTKGKANGGDRTGNGRSTGDHRSSDQKEKPNSSKKRKSAEAVVMPDGSAYLFDLYESNIQDKVNLNLDQNVCISTEHHKLEQQVGKDVVLGLYAVLEKLKTTSPEKAKAIGSYLSLYEWTFGSFGTAATGLNSRTAIVSRNFKNILIRSDIWNLMPLSSQVALVLHEIYLDSMIIDSGLSSDEINSELRAAVANTMKLFAIDR